MAIDNEYLVFEQIAAEIRAALGTGVKVFESVPFLPTSDEFDDVTVTTVEGARFSYFWVVQMDGVAPEQFATMYQRERLNGNIYGYITRSDKPGSPATDPGVANAFASGTATAGSTTTLTDSNAAFTVDAYANTHELWARYADGTLDHRRILSNTATVITVRQAFGTAIASGVTYEVWLRPSEWLMREQARLLVNTLTTNRSAGGRATTGNTPGYTIEPIVLYERGMWRVTIPISRDQFLSKSYA